MAELSSGETEIKTKKRASARPLYKDIFSQFMGDSDLLGIYCFILAKVAWGEHTTTLRKKYKVSAEQYVTTLNKLSRELGKDKRRVKRELAVLTDMGVITVEPNGNFCLIITNTNKSTKSVEEASVNIPKAKRPSGGKCHHSNDRAVANATIQRWQMPPFDETSSGKCHHSNDRAVANATIRAIPSLLEKKKREEEFKEEGEKKKTQNTPPISKEIFISDLIDNVEDIIETNGDATIIEATNQAESWSGRIKKIYPRSRLSPLAMLPIVKGCRRVMLSLKMDPADLLVVLGVVNVHGSQFQQNKIFGYPKDLLKTDKNGHTLWNEICELAIKVLKKEEKSMARRSLLTGR